jgi:16S rRNA processing protein RimM
MKLIEIGKIVRSQGLKGRVKVLSFLQSQDVLELVSSLYVGAKETDAVCYVLNGVQQGNGFLILKFEGIDSRNDADRLKGQQVWMVAEGMAPLAENEYYWSDIIGLKVVTEDNEHLGRIEAVFPTGSNDVYVCRNEDREILLPAIEQVIRRIDPEKGVMVVRLCKGLIEQ